jgi:hypothetical protein
MTLFRISQKEIIQLTFDKNIAAIYTVGGLYATPRLKNKEMLQRPE